MRLTSRGGSRGCPSRRSSPSARTGRSSHSSKQACTAERPHCLRRLRRVSDALIAAVRVILYATIFSVSVRSGARQANGRCITATTRLCGKPFPPRARMHAHVARPSGLVGSGVANVNTRVSCETETFASKAVSTKSCAGNMLVTSNARIASSVEARATSTLAEPRRIGTGREEREKRWACPRCTHECLPQAHALTQRGVAASRAKSPNHLPSRLENLKLRWDSRGQLAVVLGMFYFSMLRLSVVGDLEVRSESRAQQQKDRSRRADRLSWSRISAE